MNNKKGFTLIELLAVIVILAILVLLAMPAVTSIMESSGRNTFKNEILGLVKTMENAYTEKWGNGDVLSTFDDDTNIHTVTKDGKTYSYLCMTLQDLYDEQYIKKNLGDNYGGYIQMYVGENDTYTYINTTNGTYYMQGEYGALSASTYEPTKSNNGTEVTKETLCPNDETALEISGGSSGGNEGESTTGAVATIKALVTGADDTLISEIGETGLAYDGTIDKNLRYIGANPDNYVEFNDELWRIIGVMNNIEIENGQKKSLLKIRRSVSLGKYSWDTSSSSINQGYGINQWGESTYENGEYYEGADLMRELNYDYLGDLKVGTDNHWYGGNNNYKRDNMPQSVISVDSKEMIEKVVWNLGEANNNNGTIVDYDSDLLKASVVYENERRNVHGKSCSVGNSCNDTVVRTSNWTGKVGLMYPSDYGFATSGGTNKDRTMCLNTSLSMWNGSEISDCRENNWLYEKTGYQNLITPFTDLTGSSGGGARARFMVYYGNANFDGRLSVGWSCSSGNVNPVVFLKSSVKIVDGTGTSSDPYKLSLE